MARNTLANANEVRDWRGDAGSKKIPAEIEDRLFRKLQLIDDVTCDFDLRSPPSNHFEKLRGKLAGKPNSR